MADLDLRLRASPRAVRWTLAVLCLALMCVQVRPESVTLDTYYPAPTGIYTNMVTTGATTLARDGGMVGIGTTKPQAALDVAGAERLDPISAPSCSAANEGSLYYDAALHGFAACEGKPPSWHPLSGASGGAVAAPLLGGNCGPDTWSDMQFVGKNINCVAFLTAHKHNAGGSCGRYEDNGCRYDAASGFIQGFASSGTTYCGYVCF